MSIQDMNIHGLQKMTLLDFPEKVACTVFLAGCNFRCPFCHNAELIDKNTAPQMTGGELLAFLKKRQGMLDGVAFTGGEPLMSPELPELIRAVRALGFAVKLDTNGMFPEKLQALLAEDLVDYAAMDIKNSRERYAETVGLPDVRLDLIGQSMEILKNSTIDYELRTTVVEEFHNEDSFRAIGPWIAGAKRYFLQCFTDRDTVMFAGLHPPDETSLRRYAAIVRPFVPSVAIRGI